MHSRLTGSNTDTANSFTKLKEFPVLDDGHLILVDNLISWYYARKCPEKPLFFPFIETGVELQT